MISNNCTCTENNLLKKMIVLFYSSTSSTVHVRRHFWSLVHVLHVPVPIKQHTTEAFEYLSCSLDSPTPIIFVFMIRPQILTTLSQSRVVYFHFFLADKKTSTVYYIHVCTPCAL